MTMTLSGDGTITGLVAGGLPDATITTDELAAGAALNNAPNSVGFRNRIINGDMRIDQRNAGASVTPSADSTYTLDRWFIRNAGGSGRFSIIRSTTSAANFPNSVLLTVTTTATPGTNEFYGLGQNIEGYNISDLAWGTSNAKDITISFQVRSSLTGTYCVSIRNAAADRSFVVEFSIDSADTFETKTVTIPGETSGSWGATTNAEMLLLFCLGSSAGREGTAGSWQTTNIVGTSNQVDWINTSGATFYITGVQLEVGSVATPFERRPFGTELALCQRYFEKSYNMSVVPGTATAVGARVGGTYRENGPGAVQISYLVAKRATPTISIWGTDGTSGQVTDNAGRAGTVANNGETGATVTYGGNDNFVGFTQFRAEIEL